MSAITLLTYGAQDAEGTGDPVDVTAHATLRLALTAAMDHPLPGAPLTLDVFVDGAPAQAGPFSVLWSARLRKGDPDGPEGLPRDGIVQLPPLASPAWVRCRWRLSAAGGGPVTTRITPTEPLGTPPTLSLGIDGDGIPDVV